MKSRSATTLLVILAIVNIVLAGLYFMLFATIKANNQKISSLQNDIAVQEKREMILKSTKKLVFETVSDRRKLDSFFVTKDRVVEFLEQVADLGKESGVKLTITNLGLEDEQGAPSDLYQLLKLNIEARGGWQNLYHFLTMLESVPFAVRFGGVNIDGVFDDSEVTKKSFTPAKRWKMTIELSVIKLK